MKYIGILGAGNISETHLNAALEIEGLEVCAVCGTNQEKVRDLAKKAGATPFSDIKSFLSHRPMDIVAIGSPSGVHAEQGILAASEGLHVVVEKPVDITVDKIDRMISVCRENRVKLGVFFQDRVAPDLVRLKNRIDEGALGKIQLATGHVRWFRPPDYYSESRWRGTWALDGGGAIMNQGIHTLDLLLWLCGPVRSVSGFSKTLLHEIETEDTAVATLEYANGAIGTYEASTSSYPGFPRRVVISGSRGTAVVEHDKLVLLDLQDEAVMTEARQAEDRNLSESSAVVSNVDGHRKVLEDFIESIERDREPLCSGAEGRRSVELIEAIYRSAREKRIVLLGS